MKHPRWNTAIQALLRGCFVILLFSSAHAQNPDHSITISTGYLEASRIFLYPQSPDPLRRQVSEDLGSTVSFSASYRYRLYAPIAFQVRGEFAGNDLEMRDQVGTPISHGYEVWIIEAEATFSLPFSTQRFDMYVGGGAGMYVGSRRYAIAGVEAESSSSQPAFGIHVIVGAEYLLTEQLGLRADVLFRDPQMSVENRFSQSSVVSRGIEYPLQNSPFLSHINLNGNVYAIGISWHY
ncbi:MAG: hypothetical protein C0600_05085 [Ignavibacteria bacterium]|nr:MAG: hypothetical protein C0600_05085 [Ignavibacteria bacterium]